MNWLESRPKGRWPTYFRDRRLRPEQSAVTAEAVRQRRTMFANMWIGEAFPAAAEFGARSLLAAPLMVFNEVIGAVTFLHDSDDGFLQ